MSAFTDLSNNNTLEIFWFLPVNWPSLLQGSGQVMLS
jgi:hypothetical protein